MTCLDALWRHAYTPMADGTISGHRSKGQFGGQDLWQAGKSARGAIPGESECGRSGWWAPAATSWQCPRAAASKPVREFGSSTEVSYGNQAQAQGVIKTILGAWDESQA